MSWTTHMIAWLSCSWHEACRLRHPEVDLDHLLLGLLAEGGAAAALLGAHGVTLADARRAMQELCEDDLAAVGIDTSAMPAVTPVSPVEAQNLAGRDEIPMSDRAQQFATDRQASFSTSLSTLRALLRSDVPMRILGQLGVDPDALRTDLAAREARRHNSPGGAVVDPDLLPQEPATALCLRRFISASPAQTRKVLADPSLLPAWAVLAEEMRQTCPDGIISRHDSRTGRHMTLQWKRDESTPDSVIWVKTLLNGPNRGQAFAYDRFDLKPAPGGCALTFTRAYRIWRLSGRLLHPATRKLTRIGMVNTFGAIARTVAASL